MIATIQRLFRALDQAQRQRAWLAFPVAVWKKFNDDQAGNLAALIAYFTFIAIFPLLLVLVTVLNLVLRSDPALKHRVLQAALHAFPVIGSQLSTSITGLHQTGVALVVGLVVALLGARGMANAVANAFNTIWAIPFDRRPTFPWSLLRSIGFILVVGIGQILVTVLSGIAGGLGHLLTGLGGYIGTVAASLVANIILFLLAFRLATASDVRWKDLRLGAILAAVSWQTLLLLGSYIVSHLMARSSALYGVFGVVLGLLAWLFLQARLTLYAVETCTVRAWRLWPRGLGPPPTEPDRAAIERYQAGGHRQVTDQDQTPAH
ncbi:MAG: YihY/virulence factor BrkB family protein [Streptosporangiaceae bacterium]